MDDLTIDCRGVVTKNNYREILKTVSKFFRKEYFYNPEHWFFEGYPFLKENRTGSCFRGSSMLTENTITYSELLVLVNNHPNKDNIGLARLQLQNQIKDDL